MLPSGMGLRRSRASRRPALVACLAPMLVRGAAPGVTRYALRVAYDGTRFKGWQVQPRGARTVQGELNAALRTRFGGVDIATLGASRTDAGVHARGQCAHADLPVAPLDGAPLELLEHQINRLLPDDARVHDLRPAPAPQAWQAREGLPWHAIANAAGKRYAYRLTARRGSADPLGRLYRGHVAYRAVDFGRLDDALACFVGEHDFAAFANNAPGFDPSGNARSTTRAIRSATLLDEGGGDATLTFELDGALYKMVRNVVGAAVAVADGALHRDAIPALLAPGARRADNPAKAAPACGLCLEEVYYDDY